MTSGGKASSVASAIRSQIASGQLRPGDDLPPESVLTAEFEVSQPTMRSALRILESEGLLRIRRGARGGPRVLELDPAVLARQAGFYLQVEGAGLADLLEALAIMQPGAVALAGTRRTQAHLDALRSCADRAAASTSKVEFADASADFLLVLLEASGNKSINLFGLVISVLVRQEIHRRLDEDVPEHVPEAARCYAQRFHEVVDLLEVGEGEEAAALWRAHLLSAAATYADFVEAQAGQLQPDPAADGAPAAAGRGDGVAGAAPKGVVGAT